MFGILKYTSYLCSVIVVAPIARILYELTER